MTSPIFTVLMKHKPLKLSLGLIDHWFVDIPQLNMEIHMGNYSKGTHLTSGTTKNAHTFMDIKLCSDCTDRLVKNTIELTDIFYYPIINCETLIASNFCIIRASTQTIFYTAIVVTLIASIFKPSLIILALVILLIFVIYSKFLYCRTYSKACLHLIQSGTGYKSVIAPFQIPQN